MGGIVVLCLRERVCVDIRWIGEMERWRDGEREREERKESTRVRWDGRTRSSFFFRRMDGRTDGRLDLT